MFGMESGLRIGELRALMWDCIDGDEFVVKRAFADNLLQESTKTGKMRRYGFTPYARNIIHSLPVTSPSYIFVRDDGHFYTDKNLNAIWSAGCKEAGIEKIKLYNAVRHSLGCQILFIRRHTIIQNI
jgi:integrase